MTDNSDPIKGLVFNIQRNSTEDGPGIRTTVFLKGCPMRCLWCHNPEGISTAPELVWYEARCIGAKDCIDACPKSALTLRQEGLLIDRKRCDGCGDCEKACPTTALEVLGKERLVSEIKETALRDQAFYERSGGGVTLSGGEPAMQVKFSQALMAALKQEAIHIALDTCGGVDWSRLEPLVELADLILYDLKTLDEQDHLKYTGIPLQLVLDNALKTAATGKPMWIRTPIIPGVTDAHKNIASIARFIRDKLPSVERYDILAFNNTCKAKYSRLGRKYALEGTDLIREEELENLAETARQEGLDFVHWSGMTRKENGT